jgi:hypothetical protein
MQSYPCNRPWRPIGLWDVEAPIFSRQSAHRLRWGCQPYAGRLLPPPLKIPFTHFCRKQTRPQGHSAAGRFRSESESESYDTTDGQSASLSWNKAPTWGSRSDFYYCQTVAGLLLWGALSDERTGLSFTIAAGLRERSYSRVRVPWDLRRYFTVSDLRLHFLRLLRLTGLRWRYSTPTPHRRGLCRLIKGSFKKWMILQLGVWRGSLTTPRL